MTHQRGNSLQKFGLTGRANRNHGGLNTASASVSYHLDSQGSFRLKEQSSGGQKLPQVHRQLQQARNLASERQSAQEDLNALLSSKQDSRKPGLPSQAFDFTQRNIEQVRQQRMQATVEMDNARKQIDHIHQALCVDEIMLHDPKKLERLQTLMDPSLKERFMTSPLHFQVAENFNTLNTAGLAIFEQVTCYRAELGQTLSKLMQCYSALYLQQLHVFNLTDSQRQEYFKARMDRLVADEEAVRTREEQHRQHLAQIRELQLGKERQIEQLKQKEADLESHVETLQRLIEEQWKDTQKPRLLSDEEFKKAWRDLNFKWNKRKLNDKEEGFDMDKSVEAILEMETSFKEHAELTKDKKLNLLDL